MEHEKDIGVLIDNRLEFDVHIQNRVNKANLVFGIVRSSNLSVELFLMLYKSMVRSYLDYAVSVWNPYRIKYTEILENLQKRATTQRAPMKGLSYEERFRSTANAGLPKNMIET